MSFIMKNVLNKSYKTYKDKHGLKKTKCDFYIVFYNSTKILRELKI